MRALIIDDSRSMRSILGRILRELGYEIIEAENGREALDCLKNEQKLDLALVDWNMPIMDGLEFIRAVRDNDEWRGLLMMMVTTEADPAQVVRALSAGADEYLMKPFSKESIQDKLAILGIQTQEIL